MARSVITTRARRAQVPEQRRNLKMAGSAHAYVRGSTVQFYRWLQGRGKRPEHCRRYALDVRD